MTLKNSSMGNEEFVANEFKNRWDKFRDALRHEDQLLLDEMFKATEIHRDAIAAGEGNEFEKQFMAMIIEKRKIDDEFEERLDDLKDRLVELEEEIRSAL